MATAPVSTPNAYASPSGVSRASTLISQLNIVTPRTLFEFFKKYDFTSYMLLTQSEGGSLKIASKQSENKLFYHYEEYGRDIGFVTSSGAYNSGSAGTGTTVTLGAGSYSNAGSTSLVDYGGNGMYQIWYNARTGVESYASAINKAVANAHTVTLIPVISTQDSSTLANDVLQYRGYKYVGEASVYTTNIVKQISKYTNYCTQLRKDYILTDLATAERIDFPYNGQNFYTYKAMEDNDRAFQMESEMLLLNSNLANNLPNGESGTLGLIQWIQANGINTSYSSFNVQSTFAALERLLDAEGAPMSYDMLQDTDQNIEVQLALGNEFNNGAILYDGSDLRRGFKTFKPFGREYTFIRYTPLTDPRMYGSSATGSLTRNYGIGVATGRRNLDGDMSKNDMPQLIKRYQQVNGMSVYAWDYDGLSDNGKSAKLQLSYAMQEYPGLTVQGSNQFFIIKKA